MTGRPISSRKNLWVGILHACRHVLAHPALSKKRHFSTSNPCAFLVTTSPASFENSTVQCEEEMERNDMKWNGIFQKTETDNENENEKEVK